MHGIHIVKTTYSISLNTSKFSKCHTLSNISDLSKVLKLGAMFQPHTFLYDNDYENLFQFVFWLDFRSETASTALMGDFHRESKKERL